MAAKSFAVGQPRSHRYDAALAEGATAISAPDHPHFADLISSLSSQFINIRSEHVDGKIEDALCQLATYLKVDRATFAQFHHNRQIWISHTYSVPGFGTMPPKIVDDVLPWLAGMIRDGQVVAARNREFWPDVAEQERRWVEAQGIHSQLSIPCSVGGMPICAIAFCSRHERDWPQPLIARMRLCGEVFANALARKTADQQLQSAREQLAQMVRVSTAGHLAPSIAHELNQPLCAIIGNAHAATEMLSAASPDLQEVRAALRDVMDDAKRAGEVVERTHAMLKRHVTDHTLQDLKQLAEGAMAVIGSYAIIRRVAVDASFETVAPVLGHAVQIHQVITNLLVNAVDSIAPDQATSGRVELSLRTDPATGSSLLSVHDNGMGINPEAAERVFDPYYTTKPKGLGMGLSIARAIVDAHGGALWMEPNADGGVTFFMSLPVHGKEQP